ncbi:MULTISPECIES: hypothetical protein [unclassified Paenibacillus]|uniref:hypothetical protein n=1 Tax=unclassified Paenibacillus TaxID=185978 RepID=UPI0024B9B89F|nr:MULTISPECIES: hypothetical protein [unclassified Paenibacillus]
MSGMKKVHSSISSGVVASLILTVVVHFMKSGSPSLLGFYNSKGLPLICFRLVSYG